MIQTGINRFYKRYWLTLRKPTHLFIKMYHFYDDQIWNTDEEPLVFNLVPNRAVATIEEKSFIFKTMIQ